MIHFFVQKMAACVSRDTNSACDWSTRVFVKAVCVGGAAPGGSVGEQRLQREDVALASFRNNFKHPTSHT